MDPAVFEGFREIAYRHAGIALRAHKEALVSSRIAKRVRSLGLRGEREYLDFLKNDRSGEELVSFLDAISTNFTSFYRERDHFETLSTELLAAVKRGTRRVRLWCAAAATGEEPYTLAITLAEALDGRVDDWRILATDISTRALATASAGRYEASKLALVPAALRVKYFKSEVQSGVEVLTAKGALRDRLMFKRLNLATPPFPLRGELDFVFCRNVMIYFDTQVRQRLVSEIERLLKPGGLLVVAHAETLSGVTNGLGVVRPSVYRKAG